MNECSGLKISHLVMFHIEVHLFPAYKTSAIIVVYLLDAENILVLVYGQQMNEKVIVKRL